ncbi:elongation factor P maturation arginine rhamnosyltransferase EarP [Shewanella surugensis]|uniref:Protein-arginine rhamnosyltransferase n=1 Tax=Shewanella surugensis TaxID=212020 RepID=A0ABT0LF72_9GAMM|nr:elongation factor P maturation arginine rhamnosyltransferase EarP [Shewanella surugensis]MCL1126348.1 elongation factor P maturation arginine rhamnosyltransferase EarP [Shewanella surugensis]
MNHSIDTAHGHWDIFCTVIDNYGDIGVTWRLAKQLTHDFGIQVTLWVDCLASFHCILPQLDPGALTQQHDGVTIEHWQTPFIQTWQPGNVLIEAFACELPNEIKAQWPALPDKPLWINLDYLSAEQWVDDCHGLPSLLPNGQVRYFFFPGFSAKSGGLICEHDLFKQQHHWLNNATLQHEWLHRLGFEHLGTKVADATYISVFSYPSQALTALSHLWQQGSNPIHLLIPFGQSLESLKWMLADNDTDFIIGHSYQASMLHVHVLPMTIQEDFDKLLWYCDINIVRGEDSFLRAQWAKKPFIWHIYPQQEAAHLDKLTAFMAHYCQPLACETAEIWQALCLAFNQDDTDASQHYWPLLQEHIVEMNQHAKKWPQQALNEGDLATRLVNFVKKG